MWDKATKASATTPAAANPLVQAVHAVFDEHVR
jgi:hypothetical protein